MRHVLLRAWAALALLLAAAPAFAIAPVPVVIGSSRDGALHDLQRKVDKLVGRGRIDVRTDFIGAHPGDPDPFAWDNTGSRVLAVQLVDRKSSHGTIGWYDESAGRAVIDGIGDGIVLDNWRQRGARGIVRVPSYVTRFGFYIDYDGDDSGGDSGHYRYFSNRRFNDVGPRGRGAEHAPYDGDVQMLVYDVSPWLGSGTWLVACEYSDSGCPVGFDNGESDNDFADIVFTVSSLLTTPAQSTTFAQIKALYR